MSYFLDFSIIKLISTIPTAERAVKCHATFFLSHHHFLQVYLQSKIHFLCTQAAAKMQTTSAIDEDIIFSQLNLCFAPVHHLSFGLIPYRLIVWLVFFVGHHYKSYRDPQNV